MFAKDIMLASKFSNTVSGSAASGNRISALLSKQKSAPNKIIEMPLEPTCVLGDELLNYGTFSVQDDGYFHVSTQLCIKQIGKTSVVTDFLQFGICETGMVDYEKNFSSQIINSSISPEHVLSYSLGNIVQLKSGVKYTCWLNFSSDKNSSFQYTEDCSHLRLYKL